MPGGTLSELYITGDKDEHLPFSESVRIAIQVAKGMMYLHSLGIIHRDLHSGNILLDGERNARISDFGLSRLSTGDLLRSRTTGHKGYIAPESIKRDQQGLHVFSTKGDVFSFSLLMWEMTSRKFALAAWGGDIVAWCSNIAKGERPPTPKKWHVRWVAIMKQCWHQDPHGRPTFEHVKGMLKMVQTQKPKEISSYRGHFREISLAPMSPLPSKRMPTRKGSIRANRKDSSRKPPRHTLSIKNAMNYRKFLPADFPNSLIYLPSRCELNKKKKLASYFGTDVYRGKLSDLSVTCIVKKDISESEFASEVAIINALSEHPHIAQFYGVWVADNPILILEPTKRCLEDYLIWLNVRTDNVVVRNLATSIACAMKHLHDNSLIHRYLTNKTILVDSSGEAKIADFGHATKMDDTEPAVTDPEFNNVPIARWLPPESLGAIKFFSKHSDVWMFGCVLYSITTQMEPHHGIENTELAVKIADHQLTPTPPSHCIPSLKRMMLRCWSQEPEQRPSFTRMCQKLSRYSRAESRCRVA